MSAPIAPCSSLSWARSLPFFLLAAGQWSVIALLRQLGGYADMITGALAFYLASAQLIDETFGSDVVPLASTRNRQRRTASWQ